MPDHDAPPSAAPGAADRLVDDMKVFLRGGPVPDATAEPPAAARDQTRSWDYGAPTADPGEWTLGPAGSDTVPDRVIGPYRVVRWVARGGMGNVFHARHRELPLEVALKTIRGGYAAEPGVRERFRVEAAAAASLDHPNVVKLYGFDEHEGELYIAMEWAPGGDLADRLDDAGPLAPREAAALVRALAAAMTYAHGKGVLHRDLKPRNVLLTADGTPKVADFGLARLRPGDTESAGLTRSGVVMGTPAYMAPEQADGRAATARTDVYALGAILYEVLTGGPPFRGVSKEAVLAQVRQSDPPRPSSVTGGVPPDLESICLRCLSKDAVDRYPSAAELVADLDRFLNGEPLVRSPWRRVRRAARAVRRRWRWAAGVAGMAAACAATAVVMVALSRPPNGESAAVRRALEDDLRAGRPVALVGAKGWPKWFRWRAGDSADRRHFLSTDGFASAEAPDDHGVSLLELLPDATAASYRVSAKLRHDWSKRAGQVGVYVGHQAHPGEAGELQTFTVLRFNGVVGHVGLAVANPFDPDKREELVAPNTSAIDLHATVLADRGDGTQLDFEVAGVRLGRIQGKGDRSGHWYDIELTVTADGVTASLDGVRTMLTTADVRKATPDAFARLGRRQPADAPRLRLVPDVGPAPGGLGLYLTRGGVSLRDVTVTPLPQ